MSLPNTILDVPTVLPELESVMAYRGVYALCTVNKDRELKATHFVSVLIGGPRPIWGCWLVSGKFMRFFSSRYQIEEAYPRLVWRRKMATWTLVDMTHKSVETRRAELETLYSKRIR